VAAPFLLLVAVVAYGAWRLPSVRADRVAAPALRVGVVQGNVGVERKGDRSFFTRNLADYRDLSDEVAGRVDLLIWPETVVQQRLSIAGTRFTPNAHPYPGAIQPLLFGGLGSDTRATPPRLFNSAFLVTEGGRIAGRYDKRVLVPFGEYMPLGDRFPALRAMSPATGNFSAGTSAAVLDLGSGARLGCLICYEDVIPWPAREAVAAGATLLINLTNDAWYGDGAEPVQHQALAVWRAVENRRDLVRSTNTGLTAVVSATGEVLGELPTFEAATLVREVRLLAGPRTVYGRVGDTFGWSLVVVLGAVVARRIASAR
jgi:apolipoprotein N-acyltransferase